MSTERSGGISVLITVYNHAAYLGEAIESVLAQTLQPAEIIVVDDGSDDGSDRIVKGFLPHVVYKRQAHQGIAAARNRAVELSRGEYLAFLDADDRYVPNKGELQMLALRDHDIAAVFGHVREFRSPELPLDVMKRVRTPQPYIAGWFSTTMLIRREAFLAVGPFSTTLRRAVGLDWQMRFSESGLQSVMLPDVLVERRLHQSNHGLREREAVVDYTRALKASLDRRRRPNDQSSTIRMLHDD